MPSGPQAEPTEIRINLSWLRVVRVAALCSLLAILVPWYVAIFSDSNGHHGFDFFLADTVFPLWLPYLWVFLGLRSTHDSQRLKKALAVAVGCGSLILILFSLILTVTSFSVDRKLALIYSFIVFLQIVYLLGALKTYYSMDRDDNDLKILATRVWVPVVGIAVIATMLPALDFQAGHVANEASAVGTLRTINTAQAEYARVHPERRFASSLAELGPDSAQLIDSVLATGRKSMYVFYLTASAPDSDRRVNRYSITARPMDYRKNKHSFFIDETGVTRFTLENRSATASDPALQ